MSLGVGGGYWCEENNFNELVQYYNLPKLDFRVKSGRIFNKVLNDAVQS